jgi:hypothetical protein
MRISAVTGARPPPRKGLSASGGGAGETASVNHEPNDQMEMETNYMSEEKDMKNTPAVALAAEPDVNPYSADALERINRVRAVLDGFPKSPVLPSLTPGQLGIAKRITVEALAQAARLAEERPNLGGDLADVPKLRDATHFLLAYEGLRERAFFLLRDLDQLIAECKVDASKYARGLYRIAKAYAESAPKGNQVQAQIEVMRPAFGRRRRAKPAPPADPEAVKK